MVRVTDQCSEAESIEDNYFFEVNTKYISLSVLKKKRIFISAQHE